MNRKALLSIPILLILGSLALGQVQTTTAINGAVTDETGGVLPGVEVTIRNQETGATRTGITNDVGRYNFPSLKPGTYSITAALTGFKTAIVTDREAMVAIPAQVNIILTIGELTENVTVSAAGEELVNPAFTIWDTTIASLNRCKVL